MTTKQIESIILSDLFERLHRNGIIYAVLRNYDTLPDSLGGSDLDLLVSSNKLDKVYEMVKDIARFHGGRCITCIDDFKVTVINARFCGKDAKSSSWWGLPIDLFCTLGLRQYEHFDTQSVLNNSIKYNGIRVAAPEDAAITAFLKECLANGKSRKNYEKGASLACVSNEARHKKILDKYFGCYVANLWIKYLTSASDALTLRKISRLARRVLPIKAFFRNPLHALHNELVCIWRRWLRVLNPPGFSVAVVGTDGSGKSTVINGIEPIMIAALHKKPIYEHLRPNLFPSIAKLFGRPEINGPVTNPHASKPSGFIGSCARLLYYSLDYILGYWLKVHPMLIKKQNLYVFDRYFYDYLIDPQRSRIKLPKWLIKSIVYFFPQPDLILCLGGDPLVIHKRKPEISLEEVKRQVTELKSLCENNNRTFWINTDCSINESVDKALEAITSRMAARYVK